LTPSGQRNSVNAFIYRGPTGDPSSYSEKPGSRRDPARTGAEFDSFFMTIRMRFGTTMGRVLTGICAVSFLGAAMPALAESQLPQYYELRVYSTRSESQQLAVTHYWEQAAVPAYNRLGVKPIGVFTEQTNSPTNHVYVLLPFSGAAEWAAAPARLAADAGYQRDAAEFFAAPKSSPTYERYESSLMVAFDGMKQLAVPPSTAEKKPWIFELRTYWSHNEVKGANKVQMFNSGEIPLMNQVGLAPVFFGQTVAGPQLPNLVYLVSGEDQEAHKAHWKAFFADPVWKRLIGDTQYKDNVSRVISTFLVRTSASQI